MLSLPGNFQSTLQALPKVRSWILRASLAALTTQCEELYKTRKEIIFGYGRIHSTTHHLFRARNTKQNKDFDGLLRYGKCYD